MTAQTPIAFVAGATGYTGQEVVRALRRRDIRTVAHVRPDSSRRGRFEAEWTALGAEPDSTPWEPEAMGARLAELKPTLVFGLLGTTKSRVSAEKRAGGEGLDYEAVDYGMTMMVLAGCERVEPPPRFVYLSALGVREASPGSYYHARWKVEQALRSGTVPWTIAQPSFISGADREESRPMERLGSILAGPLLKLGGRRTVDKWGPIGAAVLGEGLVRHALDPEGERRTVTSAELR